MKLTIVHRKAFVSSVMNDVPQIDYQKQVEVILLKDMIEQAPPKVAEVLKEESLRSFVLNGYNSWCVPGGYNCGITSTSVCRGYEPSSKALAQIKKLVESATAQYKARRAMKDKVQGSIDSCSTLKAAQERLPEFVKYLPAEAEKSVMLPALRDLAADLMKMGWSKGAVPA